MIGKIALARLVVLGWTVERALTYPLEVQKTGRAMKTRGTAWIGGILQNPKSAHWHWARQRKWAAGWRELTAYVCTGIVDAAPEVPKRITLTAHVTRKFDTLNLQVVLSPIIDGLQVPRPTTWRIGKATKEHWGRRIISPGWPGAGVIDSDGNEAHQITLAQVVDRERQGVEVVVEVL